ncbi:hypothetical protein NE857_31630 [Nocardiopsis exhalans]|uniref:Uncharacterized protein n=1 Tax=Nocardiopsis exhalans TaxID=163604 RepID=A0ABY5D7K9_9ACTN|nr:hypothetical protein [Nocardiopsis exhalans]USY19731.1 hypothetical protein NE857_31630 [Nocardiopsis exhalans]
MAASTDLLHPMLATAGQTAVEASLHTADPGSTGANEVSGGDYERVPVAWDPPSGGAITADDELVFLVPALGSDEVTHVGLWNASGDWLIDAAAAVPQPFPTAGTATVEVLSLDMTNGTLSAQVSS